MRSIIYNYRGWRVEFKYAIKLLPFKICLIQKFPSFFSFLRVDIGYAFISFWHGNIRAHLNFFSFHIKARTNEPLLRKRHWFLLCTMIEWNILLGKKVGFC